MFTFLVNVSYLHVVIHSMSFCGDCNGFSYSNVIFLKTGFYYGFDGLICFAKNVLSINTISRYKIDPRTSQKASEMQYPLFISEFTRKVNSTVSTPCVVFSLSWLPVKLKFPFFTIKMIHNILYFCERKLSLWVVQKIQESWNTYLLQSAWQSLHHSVTLTDALS